MFQLESLHQLCIHNFSRVQLFNAQKTVLQRIHNSEPTSVKIKVGSCRGNPIQDTSGLSCQCSATELQQPDNQTTTNPHNPLYVVLNTSVAHLAATQICTIRPPLRVKKEIFSIRRKTYGEWFSHQNILHQASNQAANHYTPSTYQHLFYIGC